MNTLQRMANKRAVRLNLSVGINKCLLGGIVFLLTGVGCFGQLQKGIAVETAREALLTERFNDAVISYALAAKNSTDPSLISEYAYALALSGIYDAALVQLDRLWGIGKESVDANYYTSQVYALMGYEDLGNDWWKKMSNNKIPAWLGSKPTLFLTKYKRKMPNIPPQQQEIIADFNRANELASLNYYFQALALFRQIIDACPEEFLPYVGYSITLEKAGALEQSLQALEKGITLIPNDADHKEIKQVFKQRTIAVGQKLKNMPAITSSRYIKPVVVAEKGSQMMAYVGGMIASSYTNFNMRYGYFVSGKSNGSLDMGVTKTPAGNSSNMGFSFYNRQNIFVSGMGIMANFQKGTSAFYYKISVGLSFMNKKRSASYDIFLDGNKGFKNTDPTIIGMSLGRSIYFGKRK
jgi:tetratricopeptide (TPR) repeat protein